VSALEERPGWGLGAACTAALIAVGVPAAWAIWMDPGRVGSLLQIHTSSGDALIHFQVNRAIIDNRGPLSYGVAAALAVAMVALLVVALRTPAPSTRRAPKVFSAVAATLLALAFGAAVAQIPSVSSNLWVAPVLFPAGLLIVPAAALCSSRYAAALAGAVALAAAGGVIVTGLGGAQGMPTPDLMMCLAVLAAGLAAASTGARAAHPAQLVTGGLLVGGVRGATPRAPGARPRALGVGGPHERGLPMVQLSHDDRDRSTRPVLSSRPRAKGQV